jgi:hypothetical protein
VYSSDALEHQHAVFISSDGLDHKH